MAITGLTFNSPIDKRTFLMIDNYIYLHHVNKYIVLPSFIDSVTDSQQVHFSQNTPLARSAPIYSYSNSGPRIVQVSFDLHRDLLYDINKNNTSIQLSNYEMSDDYVDLVIKYIQASTLPTYEASYKMVNPPLVSLRLGNDIFIKGVINGNLGITYRYPILSNGRYADVQISFSVAEVDPYDANMVLRMGSFRNISTTLERAGDNFVNMSSDYSYENSSGRNSTNQNKVKKDISGWVNETNTNRNKINKNDIIWTSRTNTSSSTSGGGYGSGGGAGRR